MEKEKESKAPQKLQIARETRTEGGREQDRGSGGHGGITLLIPELMPPFCQEAIRCH